MSNNEDDGSTSDNLQGHSDNEFQVQRSYHSLGITDYVGYPSTVVNQNVPFFTEVDIQRASTDVFEEYSLKDDLGRCGPAVANICVELMPTTERGEIGSVTPSGWHQAKYDKLKDAKDNPAGYAVARCHLIGYQLAGENANDKNLITGTFYFNVEGMEPYENAVASYVRRTKHHVLYRVTPMYTGRNLIADGVLIEAMSIEDSELQLNVFCYNVFPQETDIYFDYEDGNTFAR